MQTMVAAVFTRLRQLPLESDLTIHTLSSAVSLSSSFDQGAGTGAGPSADGVRMSAPDPRGAHIPAAGAEPGNVVPLMRRMSLNAPEVDPAEAEEEPPLELEEQGV